MTWFGTVSAWGAVAVGVLFAAYAALQFSWGDTPYVLSMAAVCLLVGGYRTLRKKSGGLRLLAGAWGLAAGLMMLPYIPTHTSDAGGSYAVPNTWLIWLVVALPAFSLVGLALTVLHKETK